MHFWHCRIYNHSRLIIKFNKCMQNLTQINTNKSKSEKTQLYPREKIIYFENHLLKPECRLFLNSILHLLTEKNLSMSFFHKFLITCISWPLIFRAINIRNDFIIPSSFSAYIFFSLNENHFKTCTKKVIPFLFEKINTRVLRRVWWVSLNFDFCCILKTLYVKKWIKIGKKLHDIRNLIFQTAIWPGYNFFYCNRRDRTQIESFIGLTIDFFSYTTASA